MYASTAAPSATETGSRVAQRAPRVPERQREQRDIEQAREHAAVERDVENAVVRAVGIHRDAVVVHVRGVDLLREHDAIALGPDAEQWVIRDRARSDAPLVEATATGAVVDVEGRHCRERRAVW